MTSFEQKQLQRLDFHFLDNERIADSPRLGGPNVVPRVIIGFTF